MSKVKTGLAAVEEAGKVLKKLRDLKKKKNDPIEAFLKKNKKSLLPEKKFNLGVSAIAAGTMTPLLMADLKNAKKTGRYTEVKRKFMKIIDPKSPAEIKAADKLFHDFVGYKKPKSKKDSMTKGGMKKKSSSVQTKIKRKRSK